MSWDGFFTVLSRINNVLIFLALCALGIMMAVEYTRYGGWTRGYDDHGGPSYGEPGLDRASEFEGEEIEVEGGFVVRYKPVGAGSFDEEIEAENISLVHMPTGRSGLVLDESSSQVVLRFEELGRKGEGSSPAKAYMVLAGSREDYRNGLLDLVIGRLDDLEQRVVAKRVHFVDTPALIDGNTLSLVVWPTPDTAQYWLIDLRTFETVLRRPVELPSPRSVEN